MGLIAELTHRCPLRCPYCSNPLKLDRAGEELDTETWRRVILEASSLGVLQLHLTGGEPMARRDLSALVREARDQGLYVNLITSGMTLTEDSLSPLAAAGLEHVQLSFQDIDAVGAERIGGVRGAQDRKLRAAATVVARGLSLTTNFVVHRLNIGHVGEMLALAERLGADRVEIAHTQYHGWGLLNRSALLPGRADLERATEIVEQARARLGERMRIDYVIPDYHATWPKACMGGWARLQFTITPSGLAMPCHAAESLPGLTFPSVRDRSLSAIWHDDPTFRRFRGTSWMPEPCRSCDRRSVDWGGCRCQAFALTGDASRTDPVCTLSPDRHIVDEAIAASTSEAMEPTLIYRRVSA